MDQQQIEGVCGHNMHAVSPGEAFRRDLIAGTAGGVCGIVVGQPFDTIKVRLQTQGVTGSKSVPSKHSTGYSVRRPYSGVMDCAKSMLRREGPASFFKGLMAPVCANAPINAIVFVVHGGVTRQIQR